MDHKKFISHISEVFNVEMEEIITMTMTMGRLVSNQIRDALKALDSRDKEAARQTINRENEVNQMEVAIGETCTGVLATRQPTASDLRLLVAASSITGNMERIGDEAQRIAEISIKLADENAEDEPIHSVETIGKTLLLNLENAINAFERMDPVLALGVIKTDQEVNDKYEALLRQLVLLMMDNSRLIPWALDMIWVARSLERIGDHIKNIGEATIYLVKGKDVRHAPTAEMEKAILG